MVSSKVLLGVVFSLLLLAGVSAWSDIIPDDREITWDPGVRGDIPVRTTICAVLSSTNTTADRSGAIQSAITGCGVNQVVYLGPGTYYLNSQITMKNNVTVRGAGKGVTILKTSSSFSAQELFFFVGNTCYLADGDPCQGSKNVVGGATKNSSRVSITGHGYSVGDFIVIDRLSDLNGEPPVDSFGAGFIGRAGRAMSQIVQVTGVVDTNTVDITPALYYNFDSAYTPQAVKLGTMLVWSGIENMTLNATISNQGGNNVVGYVRFHNSANNWLYNVEMHGVAGRAVWLFQSMWITMRAIDVYEKAAHYPGYGTDGLYGVYLGANNGANLIEDSNFRMLQLPMSFEGSGGGNVFAYNYITDVRWNYPLDTDYPCRPSLMGHGGHAMMNLLEGNVMDDGRIGFDHYFGTHAFYTIFRNRLEQERENPPACTFFQTGLIDIQRYHHSFNIIGNVLGTSGYENDYELYKENYVDTDTRVIFRTGYNGENSNPGTGGDDEVYTTMLRNKNFDFATNSIKSCNGAGEPGCQGLANVNEPMPASLYLKSKPSWFGSVAWPAIGSDVTTGGMVNSAGHANKIPAQLRFEKNFTYLSGSGNEGGNDVTLLVNKTGLGGGTVSASGINCGNDCGQIYSSGTSVTLTASANATSTFVGWSGACSGIASCILNMDSNKSVIANFSRILNPSDSNLDSSVSVSEFTLYNQAYKLNLGWANTGQPPSSTYYSRALALFKLGGPYHFDNTKTCPLCWATGP